MGESQDDLIRKIRNLEKQVAQLNSQLKEKRFGLTWIDVPEAFEKESENKIPVLEEVPELAIHNNDGKPTHILIEGDNYHALSCLNFTHRNSIDLIYFDPPYNTGKDDFIYRDKRFLDQYPDGTPIPHNHPLRHSSWLSFMEKRLKLAFDLLSERGVMFISIDDNEQARLKLLCDQLFGEERFITDLIWRSSDSSNHDSKQFSVDYNHTLVYAKKKDWEPRKLERTEENNGHYHNPDNDPNGPWFSSNLSSPNPRQNLMFDIISPQGYAIHPPRNGWRWSYEKMQEFINNGSIVFVDEGRRLVKKTYLKDQQGIIPSNIWWDIDVTGHNRNAKYELKKIFYELKTSDIFKTPKPTKFISRILDIASYEDSIILDFFAGSGTTLHSTLLQNKKDGEKGRRQCILVQINEANICRDATYIRCKRAIEGYSPSSKTNVLGLGNSLKYYRTAFVGKNAPKKATDDDRLSLAKKAGCLLSIAENTLYEKETTDYYQIFTDEQGLWTAIYFQENYSHFEDFKKKVIELKGKKNVYVFCWTDGSEFAQEFEYERDVEVRSIPQPILDIYKSLNA